MNKQELKQRLSVPVIGAPLFIVSNPDLVLAQCKAGIVGSFPALNARPAELLEAWLKRITEELDAWNQANPDRPAAPFAVNQIVHKSNSRLEHDLEMTVRYNQSAYLQIVLLCLNLLNTPIPSLLPSGDVLPSIV